MKPIKDGSVGRSLSQLLPLSSRLAHMQIDVKLFRFERIALYFTIRFTSKSPSPV